MFLLYLNDMRFAKAEYTRPVARAETREALTRFMAREAVEPYRTDDDRNVIESGRWYKVFRRGGPLEWFNELSTFGGIEDIGDLDSALRNTVDSWEAIKRNTLDVGGME